MTLYKDYLLTVGLEVHVELKTESKIFCSCSTSYGAEPNSQCCPVCTGMPGALPVLNKQVPLLAVKAGLALGCKINEYSGQDRKNYFYPDLPKGYQISQYDRPLCYGGSLTIEGEEGQKRVEITRIHIEEDAGKLIHRAGATLIDCNRCGVPLIEIVTAPQITSPEEAKDFLLKLRTHLLYTEVSDCRMNEGSMRCDVNLSVRKEGQLLGQRTEIKNLNSFAFVMKAIEQEYKRQVDLLEAGGRVVQETRRFDEKTGRTEAMRKKENAPDYRFFPDPDLPPVVLSRQEIEEIAATLPRLPLQRQREYSEKYGLGEYDCKRLTAERERADFFEEAVKHTTAFKTLANLVIEEFSPEKEGLSPLQMAELADLLEEGTINSATAKRLLKELAGKKDVALSPYVEEQGLSQIKDEEILGAIVDTLILENPKAIEDYKRGKKNAAKALLGGVMKKTAGRADPLLAERLIAEALNAQ